MKNLLLVVFMSTIVTGCSTMKGPVSEQRASSISKVATVSALGNNYHNTSIGTTVFGNDSFIEKVPDWKIDEFASIEAARFFSNTRVSAKALQVSGLDEVDSEGVYPDTEITVKKVLEAASREGFDTVILIHKARSSNYPQFTPGFGFYERSFLGSSNRCAYGMYIVSVVDTKSQKIIGWEWGGASPCDFGSDSDLPIKKSFSEYSSKEKLLIKNRIEARLKTSIRYALNNLGLLK